MKRLLTGAAIAAAAVFFWGFVYWNVLPVRGVIYQAAADEQRLGTDLQAVLPASGVYELPRQVDVELEEGLLERYRKGPVAEIVFLREGAEPYALRRFVLGFLHILVSTLLMGGLLFAVLPALPSLRSRLGFVLLAGLTGSLFAHMTYPIWYSHPWSLYLIRFTYDATSWLLVALILPRFVHRRG